MPTPAYAHPAAHAHLVRHLPRLDTTDGLLHCAIAVALHDFPETDAESIDETLRDLARSVQGRVRSASDEALLAHLHDVLFEEAGFAGNVDDYYSPLNSYLPAVLTSRRGLPILLTLVYKVVGERAGLKVQGVNAPLHFMAAVTVGGKQLLIDPFVAGRALSRDEAFQRIESAAGQPLPHVDELLPVATHRQWLLRIIQNLAATFERNRQEPELKAMLELRGLVMAAS